MAFIKPSPLSLLTPLLFILSSLLPAHSVEFEVGDKDGWRIPSSKTDDFYNEWASKQRFQVNDTVRFVYKKDSVLVVNDTEYRKCHSVQPIFFSNNGDTEYTLDRPGLFYFISGVSGHCERGQKMIVKVLEPHGEPSPPAGGSGASKAGMIGASLIVSQIVIALLGFFFS
ncbi:hypothetical protein Sjap_024306 [Stephania japonica]|uniref:Phytocyanin domain-containing protein n=1 Tax=Stephania japonica TaxID=461633 RepID=A0AAP0EDC8_9MAGN